MFSETEDSTLTCVEEDPRDRSYDDSEDSDILDIDPDPLPDTSLTSSYSPQAVSSHPRRNYPSESEMLTDSLNEDVLSLIVDDGDVSGESVDMLCE